MSITKNDARQSVMAAYLEFDYDDLETGVQLDAVQLQPGSKVVGGFIEIVTAWNSATSDVIDVGDSADDDRYTSSQIDAQSAGLTALTLTGYEYDNIDDVTITWTGTGTAPSAGAGRLVIEYIATDKGDFTQG